jgi:hypothetical protein
MVFVDAKQVQLLGGCIKVGLAVAGGVFGLLQSAPGDSSVFVEKLGTFKL